MQLRVEDSHYILRQPLRFNTSQPDGSDQHSKLDRLVVQFKEANPTFYEEYFAARVVVDARGGHPDNTDVQPTPMVMPTPTTPPA